MKKLALMLLFALGITLGSTNLMAQPGFDDDTQDAPIDKGIVLLVAGAAIYGVYKIKKRNLLY